MYITLQKKHIVSTIKESIIPVKDCIFIKEKQQQTAAFINKTEKEKKNYNAPKEQRPHASSTSEP